MEYLPNNIQLHIPQGVFPLSTDSMALAHFVRLDSLAKVLDIGSGPGTLGLLICAGNPHCTVTGVEISRIAHEAALENVRRNALEQRISCICADALEAAQALPAGSFSVCVSNPPYFSGGPSSDRLAQARKEDTLTANILMQCAARALKFGGSLFLVHRAERLGNLIALGAQHNLECKRLALLRHRENDPVSLVLLQLRKGAKPGLTIEEWALYHPDGTPTRRYREIYHIEEE